MADQPPNPTPPDPASIGRGTDQSIQIPDRRIPLAHSSLHVSGDGLVIKAESGCSFTVNDHVSRSAELNDGDVVDVLGHQIRVLPGEGDAEHIVEVDIVESTIEPGKAFYDIQRITPSKKTLVKGDVSFIMDIDKA